jgi:hypothetical protein
MATLRFSATLPPYGVLAAARLAGVEITAAGDANLPKDTPPVLSFADGCALNPLACPPPHCPALSSPSAHAVVRLTGIPRLAPTPPRTVQRTRADLHF